MLQLQLSFLLEARNEFLLTVFSTRNFVLMCYAFTFGKRWHGRKVRQKLL